MIIRSLALALGAIVILSAGGSDVAAAKAINRETAAPKGCVKRLGREANYICCGTATKRICRKIPSKLGKS